MAVALQPHMTHTVMVCGTCGSEVTVSESVSPNVVIAAAMEHERFCRGLAA